MSVAGEPSSGIADKLVLTAPRRLAAVMFADMVGYSLHVERDEVRNSLQAAKSVELFKSLVGDYGGAVANVAGDGILALFGDADQAMRFAVLIQNEFRQQAVWCDGEPIRFRIAISYGELTENQGIVQGHCVNVAARLQQLAAPDGIVVTSAVRDAIKNQAEVTLRSIGRPALKNLSQSTEVFAVAEAGMVSPASIAADRSAFTAEAWSGPSIAVLALQNLSGDPANEHLCEGVVEDIIADLTRFRNLMVIAKHSAFLFSMKSQPAREIGHRLGVRYLLGGSLRRAGKRIRIAVQLIDAMSENALWSDQFNVETGDLFDVLDEITGAVASRLAVQIDLAERRQEASLPHDMRAYGQVLRAQLLSSQYSKESNAHARRLLDDALVLAPRYGRVYSSLSRTHNLDWRYSWSASPEASLQSAVELAARAVDMDELDARGFAERGFAQLYKKSHDESLADYSRALALNPNDADIIAEYADALVYAGQAERSIELLQRAMRLNPFFPDWYLWYLADAQFTLQHHEDVVATVQRMQNPDEGRRMLAASFAHRGMMEEARAQAAAVLRLHPGFTIGSWRHRPPYRDQRDLERFIEGLRKAGLPD